jgi:hypothetical protein
MAVGIDKAGIGHSRKGRAEICLPCRPSFCTLRGKETNAMKKMTIAYAIGTALVLSLATSAADAKPRKQVVRAPQERLIVTAPVLRPTPWDYNIVPRYRYRPEDDKVDPYGPPLVPSYVRYEGWRWPYWW